MRIAVLQEIPDDFALQREWNALALRMESPQVFYTHEWALAVQRAYSPQLQPLLVLAYDERNSLCGVAALALDVKTGDVTFLAANTGDYCDFLSAPESKQDFVTAVLAELKKRGCRKFALANLPADSATAGVLPKAARKYGFHSFARTAYVCAQVILSRMERGRDGAPVAPGQKRLRLFSKAMAGEGPLRLEHLRTWHTAAPFLQPFFQAHVGRFLEIGRISNLANARRRAFIEELSKLLSNSQWLALSRMTVGDRAVAWHYGFVFQGTWFWYHPTFDSTVEKYSPGVCLLTQVVQEAAENPALTTLDLGLGSEEYKAKFANGSRETLYVTLHNSIVEHWAARLRYHAAEAVRSSPRLQKFAETIRTRLRAVFERWRREGAKPTIAWATRQLLRTLWARDEVVFFEWPNFAQMASEVSRNLRLLPLRLPHLAMAAMEYESDQDTLAYLIRAAKRLRSGSAKAFVLLREDGLPLHFAWAAPFDGFLCPELNTALHGPRDATIVFDSWTPAILCNQGCREHSFPLIAMQLKAEGKNPWTYAVRNDACSMHALETSGFERRHSLVYRRILGWVFEGKQNPGPQAAPGAEVSAHI